MTNEYESNWKLPWIIETSGAVIVGGESCVGERGVPNLTEDTGQLKTRIQAFIEQLG